MSSFRVAIVGGSITGLATALHLEKLGIDWVLFESRSEIAPQLGASIALSPNGLAILSQLGCFSDVDEHSHPMETFTSKTSNGVPLSHINFGGLVRSKHGFDIIITERVEVVRALYSEIQSKENIHVGQKVTAIRQTDDHVELSTSNGGRWTADVVVGADGVHSQTRRAMFAMARAEEPDIFPEGAEKQIENEYGCVFGISCPTGDLKAGEVIHTHHEGILIGILPGQNDTVYWFLIFTCPRTEGPNLPRYSSEDQSEVVATAAKMQIKPGVTFTDVYENRQRTNISSLPHFAFDRWHYKRIICVGDSIHKFNPITGQGGCYALESAAALVDNIYEALHDGNGTELSNSQVEYAFQQTTNACHQRAAAGVQESMQAIRLGTWASWVWKLLDNYVMWLIPTPTMVNIMTNGVYGAYQSRTLPPAVRNYAGSKKDQ